MKKLKILIPLALFALMISSCEKEEIDSFTTDNVTEESNPPAKTKTQEDKTLAEEFTLSYDASTSEIEEIIAPYLPNINNGNIHLTVTEDPINQIYTFTVNDGAIFPVPNPERIVAQWISSPWALVIAVGIAFGEGCPPVEVGFSNSNGIYVSNGC